MKEKVINKLIEYDFDKDNYTGILYILGYNKEAIKNMLQYLNNGDNKTRNDIFEFAFKITNTEFDNIIIR